jgi:hypothetical protein
MSKIDGQGFYEKLPRFFLNIKSNCGFSEKEKKKEHVANDSIYSELDVTTVAAFC